jgi:Na+-driven multidrug efflux pump
MPLTRLTKKLHRLNDAIAIRSNLIFASMGFFWLCLVFSLLPLEWPSAMPFVQYASSGVLQLIALPLIGVGTILAARSSDQLGKEQHDAVMETVESMRKLITEIHQLHLELHIKVGTVLENRAQDDDTPAT